MFDRVQNMPIQWSVNSGLWFNLLRKTTITTFYFPAEESVFIRKKQVRDKCKQHGPQS